MIYIPIWFYSNAQALKNSWAAAKFTFQYGSIQIPPYFPKSTLDRIFTFQYGSIQMSFSLSIDEVESLFTFQYGSIQMYQSLINLLKNVIYIPIWFYSNKD